MSLIEDGKTVKIHYSLIVDGEVVDGTEGREPLEFVQGKHQIIPGLERQLVGMRVGDTKEITVPPEEGYGKANPEAMVEIPKEQLPKDVKPTVGLILQGANPDGRRFQAKIEKVNEKTVLLNLNHPLAGKTLKFNVKITDIKPAPAN